MHTARRIDMPSVLIYGQSDDLIEVDGEFEDEFDAYGCWRYLHFADGTVVRCGYDLVDEKGWDVSVVKSGTAIAEELEPELDDDEHYTDRLRLTGDILPVRCWSDPDGPTETDVEEWCERVDLTEFTSEQLLQVMRVLGVA